MIVQEADPELRSAITKLLEAGFQISPATLQFLQQQENPISMIQQFLEQIEHHPQDTNILEPNHFELVIHEKKKEPEEVPQGDELPTVSAESTSAQTITADIKIMKDPTPELASQGTFTDFVANFKDRYYRLRNILTNRVDGTGIVDIKEALKSSNEGTTERRKTVKIVGIITNKMPTKSGNIAIELEDPTGRFTAIVSQKNQNLLSKAKIVLLDQVLCVEGSLMSSDMFIVNDLFLPDVPVTRRNNRASEDVSVALISDIHFGSKQFLESQFRSFLKWLQGKEGNKEQAAIAETVKYIIINGDLVDGIGVYPNQLADITLHDLDSQYAGLAKLLQEIPNHIHVIVTPGNHDGVRLAIPRPAIDEQFLAPLRAAGISITSLGCPCQVSLHGVNFLIYHGDSLVDIMGALSIPEQEASFMAMREMLRGRHLAPMFGKGTPLAAEPRDWLVIDELPDILHCGHIHVNSVGSYRKTLIINSGTFQSQTDYQRLIGIEPTPGIVPLVNLQNLDVKTLNFG